MGDGRQNTHADAQDRRYGERRYGELDRPGQHLENAVQHRSLAAQSHAQIAAQGVAGVVPILHHQGPVQPILMPQLCRPLRRQRLVARKNGHRIAWDQVEHQKAEHRDAQENRHRMQEALGDVGQHEMLEARN